MRCPSCEAPILAMAEFCPRCSYRQNSIKESPEEYRYNQQLLREEDENGCDE